MNLRSFHLLLAGLVGMVLGAALPLLAQSVPDVVWQTNAHVQSVGSLAFSPDGTMLASGGADGTAKLWRLSDAAVLRTFTMRDEGVLTVAISPDGNYLATGSNGEDARIRLWHIADGSLVWRRGRSNRAVFAVAFSPDGAWLAGAYSDKEVRLYRVSDGVQLKELEGHSSWVLSVGFSPDSALLASGSIDWTAKLWRVADGQVMSDLIGHTAGVKSVAFCPTGSLLGSGSYDGTGRFWHVPDGTQERILPGAGAFAVAFSSDGRLFATVLGRIRFWRVSDGALLVEYPEVNAHTLAVSPDGKHFAYATDGAIVLARMPLWISEVRCSENEVTLQWQGGSGRYQVQARTNLAVGQWENLVPATTNRSASLTCSNVMFFRVQSLPVP